MSITAEGARAYYLDSYSDEIVPCDPTLEGWAAWLSEPSEGWGRDEAANDLDTFEASVLRWGADIVATRDADGVWSFSYLPEGASLVAVRYGRGMGWSADQIVGDVAGLAEWFEENDSGCDDVEYVAIGFEEPSVRLIYRTDPPRLELGGTVQ